MQNRATEIFRETVTRPPAERETYVVTACGGDGQLFAMVEQMLSADHPPADNLETQMIGAGAGGGLSAAAGQATLFRRIDSEDLSGTRFGNYELIQLVGRGGMGSVYAAR